MTDAVKMRMGHSFPALSSLKKPTRLLSTKFGKGLIFMWRFIETNTAAMGTLKDCAVSPSSMAIGAGILQRDELAALGRVIGRGIGSSNGRFQPAISGHAAA